MSSDNSLNNGITNLVVNMFVIGTADEELVLKQNNETGTINSVYQAYYRVGRMLAYFTSARP